MSMVHFKKCSSIVPKLLKPQSCFRLLIENFMQQNAILVERFPILVILVTILVTIICSTGLLKLDVDTGYGLFIPTKSEAYQNSKRMEEMFPYGPVPHMNQVLVTTEEGQASVLNKATMDIVWEIDQYIRNFTTTNGAVYRDVCQKGLRPQESILECEVVGGLKYWEADFNLYFGSVKNDADVLSAVNVDQYPDGSPVWHTTNLGGIEQDDNGYVTSAQALLLEYPTYNIYGLYEVEIEGINVITKGSTVEWEFAFWHLPIFENNVYKGLRVYHTNRRNERSNRDDSRVNMLGLVVVSVVLMLALGSFCATRLENPIAARKYHCHAIIGFFGVVSSLMSTASGFGLCAHFGLQSSLLNLTLPCVLLGIGVDDMFLIISHYEGTDVELDDKSRLIMALRDVGPSIFFTTVSDIAAFGLGALSDLVAVRNFGIYASVCVFLDFAYQITFFVAVMTLMNRISKNGPRHCVKKVVVSECSPALQKTIVGTKEKQHCRNIQKRLCRNKFKIQDEKIEHTAENDVSSWDTGSTRKGKTILDMKRAQSSSTKNSKIERRPSAPMYDAEEIESFNTQVEEFKVVENQNDGCIQRIPCTLKGKNALQAKQKKGWLEVGFRHAAKLMLSKFGRVFVGCTCVAYWVFIAISASKIEETFDASVFYPSHSMALTFAEKAKYFEVYPDLNTFEVNLIFENIDLTDPNVQQSILRLQEKLLEYDTFLGPFDSMVTVLEEKAETLADLTGEEYLNFFDTSVLAYALLDEQFYRFFDDVGQMPSINMTALTKEIDEGAEIISSDLRVQYRYNDNLWLKQWDSAESDFLICQELYQAWNSSSCNLLLNNDYLESGTNDVSEIYNGITSNLNNEIAATACQQIGSILNSTACESFSSQQTLQGGNITIPFPFKQLRMQLAFTDLPTTQSKRRAVSHIKSIIGDFFQEDPEPFIVDNINAFVFIDILRGLFQSMLGSFFYGITCVGLLVLFLFGSFRMAIATCLFLIVVDACVYAIPFVLGTTANLASYMMVMVSFGLVVDYVVHVMTAVEKIAKEMPTSTYDEALIMALVKIGPSIFLLSVTSILSALPLLFAAALMGRVFGQIYILIVLNGLFHGLVALPVVLSVAHSATKMIFSTEICSK